MAQVVRRLMTSLLSQGHRFHRYAAEEEAGSSEEMALVGEAQKDRFQTCATRENKNILTHKYNQYQWVPFDPHKWTVPHGSGEPNSTPRT